MSWTCPSCGHEKNDDSILRCRCGYEIGDPRPIGTGATDTSGSSSIRAGTTTSGPGYPISWPSVLKNALLSSLGGWLIGLMVFVIQDLFGSVMTLGMALGIAVFCSSPWIKFLAGATVSAPIILPCFFLAMVDHSYLSCRLSVLNNFTARLVTGLIVCIILIGFFFVIHGIYRITIGYALGALIPLLAGSLSAVQFNGALASRSSRRRSGRNTMRPQS